MAGAVGGTEPVTPPLLDASFVVRYLMDEPPAMADRATAVIESDQVLAIGAVTLAETAHVLRRIYGRPREQIVDALIELVQRENVVPYGLDRATLVEALRMCRPSGRVSIPDALLWAEARSSGSGVVYTFDRQFPALGIEVRS